MKIILTEDIVYDEYGDELPRQKHMLVRGVDESGVAVSTYIDNPEQWAENDGKKVGDVVEIITMEGSI